MRCSSSLQIGKDGLRKQKIPSEFKQSQETDKFWVQKRPDASVNPMEPRQTRSDAKEEIQIASNILMMLKFSQDPLS